QFTQPGARAGTEKADVVGDLEQARRQRIERAVGKDERILRAERLELVGSRDERGPRGTGDLRRDRFREPPGRIEACAHRRAALRQFVKPGQCQLYPLYAGADLTGVTGKLLAEREGRRILGVSAADLDDPGPGPGLGF